MRNQSVDVTNEEWISQAGPTGKNQRKLLCQ